MRSRWPLILYLAMALAAVAAIALSIAVLTMARVALFDKNPNVFTRDLPRDLADGVIDSARGLIGIPVFLLVVTNLCWFVGVGFFLARRRRKPA